ncbi:RNA pseudouridine synthase 3, mitochondrial [Vitis vinifera]|uniref:RNA pseudouridine synthase 3, mitochondrial n=1 Tax=Vitis vinifera TaxID=29760 RepID=A0A438E582_VITVI|nr:RNA pseudouridine synthase 3, mitochondrial [Vitis vinifera]
MWKNVLHECQGLFPVVRHYSRIAPPRPASAAPVIRVSTSSPVGIPQRGSKASTATVIAPFPAHPLPGKSLVNLSGLPTHVTAISWIKYYFDEIPGSVDPAILVLNKPPKVPLKGNLPVHNSMDALAAAALTFDYEEGPKLHPGHFHGMSGSAMAIHEDESSDEHSLCKSSLRSLRTGLWVVVILEESFAWDDACEATCQRYWALVIGSPKQKEGVIHAPLSKVLLDDGKTERVILANQSGLEASQEAITEYRVLGPMINGCSWIELCPALVGSISSFLFLQLRVHCAEALGTPIVGDYKYGWFVHRRWKQMPRVDLEPTTGKPYKMRRPEGLDVQKGSVLSKVPLLHLHCRELILPTSRSSSHFGSEPKTKTSIPSSA